MWVPDTSSSLGALARAFFEDPSARLQHCVGVTGTNGKTTTSWLIRGMLEEDSGDRYPTGLIGTVEYALDNIYLDPWGNIWGETPEGRARDIQDIIQEEFDHAMRTNRDLVGGPPALAHATPYCIDAYQGRYSVPNTTPGPLQVRP